MIQEQSPNQKETSKRLSILTKLHRHGQFSPVLDRAIDKALAYETNVSRVQLEQLQNDLHEFEQRYHLSSAAFYHQFQDGKIDDSIDYTEWATLIQIVNNLKEKLQLLTSEDRT